MPFLCQWNWNIYSFHASQNIEVKRNTDLVDLGRDILYPRRILQGCGYLTDCRGGCSGGCRGGGGGGGEVLVRPPVPLQALLSPEQLSHVGPTARSALFERRGPAVTTVLEISSQVYLHS